MNAVFDGIKGAEGQFRKGDVVYNLNDATEDSPHPRPRDPDSDDEDDQPARKKTKKSASASRKKPDKDQEIHLKVKSMLKELEKKTPSAAEDMDESDAYDEDASDAASDSSDVDLKWKDNMMQKASEAFYRRRSGKGNLRKMVYGMETEEANGLEGNR